MKTEQKTYKAESLAELTRVTKLLFSLDITFRVVITRLAIEFNVRDK